MASHKKTPVFIRIVSNDKVVTCLNPLELSSFQILSNATIKVPTGEKGTDGKPVFANKQADTIRFYFPSGTGLSYSVGVDITAEEFNYICSTLLEFMYLNEYEFKAKTQAIEQGRMEEWNKISEENSKQHESEVTLTPTETK